MYKTGIEVYANRPLLVSDDYVSLGILYNNLGNTYQDTQAFQHYLLAKENHDKAGAMTRHAAITLYHLADMYSRSDESVSDLELAVNYAQKVLDYFQTEYSEDLYMIAKAKYMLGKVYSQFSDLQHKQSACILLNEATEIFIHILPAEDSILVKVRELVEKVRGQLNC